MDVALQIETALLHMASRRFFTENTADREKALQIPALPVIILMIVIN